ncbi:MAG: acyl-protein synthetase [Lachnospiraceae bacterium]|nr:acyl-protein synthetase [Lachnospiraceae bacterium]
MVDYDKILSIEPYSLKKKEKEIFLTKILKDLTIYHCQNSMEYRKIMDSLGFAVEEIESYYDIPALPVRLFKEYDLKSIKQEEIQKTMTSSGTTGQAVSKIYVDKLTSGNQTKVLTKIISSYIGKKRLPMVILDTSALLRNRAAFTARGAGILGFSMFGREKFYALNEEMQLDIEGMKQFLKKYEGEEILLFGFTFMIWKYFCAELREKAYRPDLSRGILIHGGGWKKLASQNITSEMFQQELKDVCGIKKVFDYYGMVEQTGTIYMECEQGNYHTSVFSDVIIRRTEDFSVAGIGEEGMIEVVSVLPKSYPGHVLLTEDKGVILGEDDCPCGRCGKYFRINGRIKNAEIRGCSDTYADEYR